MGGSSWLTAVKRAFRSPVKDAQKKTSRRSREQNDQELDEDEKKREKRRWLFRKHSTPTTPPTKSSAPVVLHPAHDHRHAIAVAAATAAAAEAAVATAQAAVEIIRLTRSSNNPNNINPSSIKQNYAAIMIQKAFRGYLARRALVALRGIVKLQALIRGQNVRKQAKMTLRCMQALLRLQTRMHPSRLSQDGASRKSMFAENTNSFWDSNSKQIPENIRERRSMSRDRRGSNSSIDWNWNDCPRTLQELEECLQSRKEAASLRRESSSSSSLAQKIWNAENEMNGERTNWLEQWMETKQWRDEQQQQQQQQQQQSFYRDSNRVSTDRRDSFVKTVEMDNNSTPKRRAHSAAATCPSPARSSVKAPSTPSSKMRTPPQSFSHSAANTPSLRSVQRLSSSISRNTAPPAVPNYMAATESARARIRSQSAPRIRPSTPERDRGSGGGGGMMAKKRLSFPAPPPANGSYSQSLRSPSFKSVQAGYVGMEQQSNQSCYTDSIGGEISPCSTTELRWWLRT